VFEEDRGIGNGAVAGSPRTCSPWSAMAAAVFLAVGLVNSPSLSAQEVHFSPDERLDLIDVALIATAKVSIDFASYALTGHAVIDALNDAEHRGVAIWIVLDPRERHDFVALGDLSDNVRIKRGGP
jgi:phosphatidylserine/phosphatidylglycerophosphate/cardiolipin synthase-like enzyme